MIAAAAVSLSCARIIEARALALGERERERAAAAVARWFRAALDEEHIARVAAGDDRSKFTLRPPVPAGTAPVEIEQALYDDVRLMRPGDAPICERNPRFEIPFPPPNLTAPPG